ncbi:MAG: hypothetical protein GY696_35885 [Gammaproteobacteria bacterium]|nr:hypothetical protein [Gammaproteobacteria bacterium]
MKAFPKKKWEQSMTLLLPQAEAGSPPAQFFVSLMFRQGLGVDLDTVMANDWLKRSAKGGFAAAQFNYGNLFLKGDGVEKDDVKVVTWWEKSANQAYVRAQFNLATFYYLGRGVAKDRDKSIFWYRQASLGGSKRADKILQKLTAAKPSIEGNGGVLTRGRLVQSESDRIKKGSIETEAVTRGVVTDTRLQSVNRWVKSQKESAYTLQLYATQKLSSARDYVSRLEVSCPSRVFQYKKGDQSWYGVICGSYSSLSAAKVAKKSISTHLSSGKPWIRGFRQIQQIIPYE